MEAQKKKALQPWTVTKLSKTNAKHYNTLITMGKYLHSLTQSRHTALLIAELNNVLCSAYLIAMAYGLYCLLGGQ